LSQRCRGRNDAAQELDLGEKKRSRVGRVLELVVVLVGLADRQLIFLSVKDRSFV
jgi:hypothetical protein